MNPNVKLNDWSWGKEKDIWLGSGRQWQDLKGEAEKYSRLAAKLGYSDEDHEKIEQQMQRLLRNGMTIEVRVPDNWRPVTI